METPFLVTQNKAELNFAAHAYPSACQAWVFGSDTVLGSDKIGDLAAHCRDFSSKWAHHGHSIRTSWILHRQAFLIPIVLPGQEAGGCAIDELNQFARALGYQVGGNWLNPQRVSWLVENDVLSTERILFKQKITTGEIHAETPFFDTTLTSVEDLQLGRLETTVKNSWASNWLKA